MDSERPLGPWDGLVAVAYGKALTREIEWNREQMFIRDAEQFAFLGQRFGDGRCNGFVDHGTWFAIMAAHDLDWPCPACGAQI